MSFINLLKEVFYKMDKVKVGLSTQIYEVYKNPKEFEINQISKNFFELNDYDSKGLSKALRGILDIKNGNIYVWNANLLHDKATKTFNLNDAYSYRLIFNPKSKVISVESSFEINIKNLNENAIKNLKNTGYKYISWINYEDDNDNAKYKYNLNTMEIEKYIEDDWD